MGGRAGSGVEDRAEGFSGALGRKALIWQCSGGGLGTVGKLPYWDLFGTMGGGLQHGREQRRPRERQRLGPWICLAGEELKQPGPCNRVEA